MTDVVPANHPNPDGITFPVPGILLLCFLYFCILSEYFLHLKLWNPRIFDSSLTDIYSLLSFFDETDLWINNIFYVDTNKNDDDDDDNEDDNNNLWIKLLKHL